MAAESDRVLVRLAEAVSDGEPVEWGREISIRPDLRDEIDGLRKLASISALLVEMAEEIKTIDTDCNR